MYVIYCFYFSIIWQHLPNFGKSRTALHKLAAVTFMKGLCQNYHQFKHQPAVDCCIVLNARTENAQMPIWMSPTCFSVIVLPAWWTAWSRLVPAAHCFGNHCRVWPGLLTTVVVVINDLMARSNLVRCWISDGKMKIDLGNLVATLGVTTSRDWH